MFRKWEEKLGNYIKASFNLAITGNFCRKFFRALAKAYDNLLDGYLNEYKKAGLQVRHYSDIEAFVRDYQPKDR